MPSDPRRIEHALELAAAGKTGDADALLTQMARQDADPLAAWHLGWLRLRAGDAEAALAALLKFPTDPACNERALEQLVGERRNTEAQALLKMTPHSPGDPRSLVAIAIAQHLARNYPAAVDACRKALALKPAYAPAHNHLGRALHNLGETAAALTEFQRAVHADPRYPEAWHNLGHALRAREDLEGSLEALERALALSPGYRSARLNLGITRYTLEQPEPALACFETLLRHDRDDIEAMVNAGLCMQALGDPAKARQRYERALELAPDHQWAHYYLGVLHAEQGDLAAARKSLRQALVLRQDDPDAWAELAGVHEACKEPDQAMLALQAGMKFAPGHALLNIQAARFERLAGDPLGAEARLSKIESAKLPSRLRQRYLQELGRVLDRNARSEAAFQAFEQLNVLAARDRRWPRIDSAARFDELKALAAWFDKGAPGIDRGEDGDTDLGADLCFLVGFPRSANPLLDGVLAAHPDLSVIAGKSTLDPLIHTLAGLPGGYPAAIVALDRGDRSMLRKIYRLALVRHGARPGHRVLDRSALLAPHAGLLQALFPKARLLHVLRHPCDVVLANFMNANAAETGGLDFLRLDGAVRSYDAVMTLWHQARSRLTLPMHEARSEAVALAPEAELAAVCGFLGLPWDKVLLDRVRPPANAARPQRAAYRWHRYRAQLQPWLGVLAPHVARLGYTLD